jgi:hypothetical protein
LSSERIIAEKPAADGCRLLLYARPFTTNDLKELVGRDPFAARFASERDIPKMCQVLCDELSASGGRRRLWQRTLGTGSGPLPADWPEPHSDLPGAWEALDFAFDRARGVFVILFSVYDWLVADSVKCPPYPGRRLLSDSSGSAGLLGGGINLRKVKQARITNRGDETAVSVTLTNGQTRVFDWQTNAWVERH